MRVDAHHHVWTLARGDYGWLTPDLPIHRDYGLGDLRPLLDDITATILVQAADTEAETRFLLATARASAGLVQGVVGWADFTAADAPDRIAALAADPLLKGLRPMLQNIEDSAWILRPEIQPALRAMQQAGLRLDLLVKPRHLSVLPELAQRQPDIPMIIDHGAKPDIARNGFAGWAAGITRLARETPWCCKFSGLVTEAAPGWTDETLRPYADHLLTEFGPARLIWGSDWPVVELAGGYARWLSCARSLAPGPFHPLIFGANAARFYGLGA